MKTFLFHRQWTRRVALLAIVAALVFCGRRAGAADRLAKSELKDGSEVRAAFREVVRQANRSMVDVMIDGRQVSLGVVVSADGLILTKASELGDACVAGSATGASSTRRP